MRFTLCCLVLSSKWISRRFWVHIQYFENWNQILTSKYRPRFGTKSTSNLSWMPGMFCWSLCPYLYIEKELGSFHSLQRSHSELRQEYRCCLCLWSSILRSSQELQACSWTRYHGLLRNQSQKFEIWRHSFSLFGLSGLVERQYSEYLRCSRQIRTWLWGIWFHLLH